MGTERVRLGGAPGAARVDALTWVRRQQRPHVCQKVFKKIKLSRTRGSRGGLFEWLWRPRGRQGAELGGGRGQAEARPRSQSNLSVSAVMSSSHILASHLSLVLWLGGSH
ncbi:unnamed protein product [Lota lota]